MLDGQMMSYDFHMAAFLSCRRMLCQIWTAEVKLIAMLALAEEVNEKVIGSAMCDTLCDTLCGAT